MARKITVEFLGKDSTSKAAAAVEKRFGKLGGKLDQIGQRAGTVLAGGLAVGGAAAVKMGQQASDLAETQSKVNQIFGAEGAAALEKFSDSAAKNLGQSKQAALDGAATFGIFGKAAGLSGADLAGFSTEMSTLASDMASFNNTSPEEAVQAIGAALRGESEPIRSYGVMLDDATLKSKAMELGIIKTTKNALTPQQKVLAAQAAILEQTKDQQGDFARTSDGLANKQRILKAQMEDLGTKIGVKVLPAMVAVSEAGLKMVNWVDRNRVLVGILVGVIGGFVTAVWAVSAAMRAAIAVQAAWGALQTAWAAKTKIVTAAQWLLNTALSANPIALIVIGVAALVAGLVIAYKKSDTFRKIVNAAFGAVWGLIKRVWGWIKDNWKTLLTVLTGPIGLAVRLIATHWSKIKGGALAARDFIVDRWNRLVEWVRNLPGRMTRAASGLWNGIKDSFRNVINWIIGKWNNLGFSLPAVNVPGLGKVGGFTLSTPDIPYLAKGGTLTRGGSVVVGERGAELLDLPAGARVRPLTNGQRNSVGGDGTVATFKIPVVVDGKVLQTSLLRLKRRNGGLELGLA